uniref:Anillin domain-containing protein n=1 Tax=Strongyloides stercoralis TaxID=6248 RepID=A0A913HVH5_STRER
MYFKPIFLTYTMLKAFYEDRTKIEIKSYFLVVDFIFSTSFTVKKSKKASLEMYYNDSMDEICDMVEVNSPCNLKMNQKNKKRLSNNNKNVSNSKKVGRKKFDFQKFEEYNRNDNVNVVEKNLLSNNICESSKGQDIVEVTNMNSHGLNNRICNNDNNNRNKHANILQQKRGSHSFIRNTPPTTPSDCCRSDDWSTFDPTKLRNITEEQANNIITESLFLSSSDKRTNDTNNLQSSEEGKIILNSDDTSTSYPIKNKISCIENVSAKNKKIAFLKKIMTRFEFKSEALKKIDDNRNGVAVLEGDKNCKNLPISKNCDQGCCLESSSLQNELNNENIISENSDSLVREYNSAKETYIFPPFNKRLLQRSSSINNSSSNFIIQILTPHQKKVLDENAAPKFSPASSFLPNIPYGKVLAVYKKETLSTVGASGTVASRITTKTMFDFKPLAHSTPFQTPKQSLRNIKNASKNRGTILPYDEKGRIFENHLSSKGRISFNSNTSHVPSLTAPSYLSHIPEEMYIRKMTKLKNSLRKIKRILNGTDKVINNCSKNLNFNGSKIELSAKRTNLIGTKRIESLKDEYEKTKTLMNIANIVPRINSKFLSIYTISDISLELNRLFCFKKTQENMSYAFCIILKCANNVVGTQVRTVEDVGSVRLKQVRFFDHIKFSKLPINFVVVLEIYAIKVGELDRTKLSRFKRSLKDFATSILKPSFKKPSLISINENTTTNLNDSLHPKNQIGYDHFTQCGVLRLNRDTIGCQKFYFEEAKFPLEGTIYLNTECTPLPQQVEVAYSGYLTIYNCDDVKNQSIKMWTIVKRSIMKFWKSCDDEYDGQLPIFIMDMSKITSPQIERIKPTEYGYKEDSFYIDIICESNDSNCIYQQKRIYFTSECYNDCDNWLQYLNEILKTIRHEPDNNF